MTEDIIHSTSQAMQQAPLEKPKLPPLIPCVEVGTLEFEMGFSLKDVLPNDVAPMFQCSICQELCRHPLYLERCGHLYCSACFVEFTRVTHNNDQCAVCRAPFNANSFVSIAVKNALLERIYKTIVVRCPNNCGFTGNGYDLDQHQVGKCPKRRIQCPNEGCTVVMEASNLENEHYPTCPKHRVYCPYCRRPVLLLELNNHSCNGKKSGRHSKPKEKQLGKPLTFVVPKVSDEFKRFKFADDKETSHPPRLQRQNATLGIPQLISQYSSTIFTLI